MGKGGQKIRGVYEGERMQIGETVVTMELVVQKRQPQRDYTNCEGLMGENI